MVIVSRFCVMRRVRFASTSQATPAPKIALPTPMYSELSPKSHPCLPAKPMNATAEKEVVPYANALIHGPTLRPPRKKSLSVAVFRIPHTPTHTITTRNTSRRIKLYMLHLSKEIFYHHHFLTCSQVTS